MIPAKLTRRERAALSALENAIEHEPVLRPVLVQDYAVARKHVHHLRASLELRVRQLNALGRHVDEPGSRSDVVVRPAHTGSRSSIGDGDGSGVYGAEDHTGFGGDGCVF